MHANIDVISNIIHGCGRIVERDKQILLHVPHGGSIFGKAVQHEADVVGIQLFQPTAYHLGRLIISGDSEHPALGSTGIYQQIHDLTDGVLIIREKPKQQFDLQRLIKIILKLFTNVL